MEHATPHLRPVIEIVIQTGMRFEELLSLTWSQVSLDRREVSLTRTKSGTPRVISLSDGAAATFVATPRHVTSPHVFREPNTGRRYKSLKNAFRSTCARAGVRDFRYHDLRHTFASWVVQGGMDLYRLGRILGHTTTQMTAGYAHLATVDLHDPVRKVATDLATGAEDWIDNRSAMPAQNRSRTL